MSRTFQKRAENFSCAHCGTNVEGTGYTNHCPKCLWSKHVDVNPGDRAEMCGGMMKPAAVEGTSPAYSIVHRCEKCGFKRRNQVEKTDDVEVLAGIVKNG